MQNVDFNLYTSEASACYNLNQGSRPYHSLGHARRVLRLCLELAERLQGNFTATEINSLALAAVWHDAVYVAGSPHNEELSAQELQIAVNGSTEHTATASIQRAVDLAKDLIRKTTVAHHTAYYPPGENNSLGSVLRDADLAAGMLSPYDEFVATQDTILSENKLEPHSNRHKSAAFLRQFLTCRAFIFGTNSGRVAWEATVRDNLVRYVAQYSKPDGTVN